MGSYTNSLEKMVEEISPEDENYREELLNVVQSFRKFEDSLDEFLLEKGYDGDLKDIENKIRYIKLNFDKAGIPLDIRTPRKWFYKHNRSSKREIAFQFCFAFHLNIDEAQDFFRKVYLQRGIDCHVIREAIYFFCICHQLNYKAAQEIIKMAPVISLTNHTDHNSEILYTDTIMTELCNFDTSEQLLSFLHKNKDQFEYTSATAYKYIHEIWKRISGENGLAARERNYYSNDKVSFGRSNSVWNICLFILGLCGNDADGTKLFAMKGDRTIQPIIKNNTLFPIDAVECFPDRQGLEGILRGEHQSYETVRKTLILLSFYRYWTSLSLSRKQNPFQAKEDDGKRCLVSINSFLVDSGYPMLYAGNPYDWIFMFASQDDFPMETFRDYMMEIYLNKQENNKEQ